MAYTQPQLDALDAAIAAGTLEVEYADKKIRYRSLAEMREIRRMMIAEMSATTPAPTKRTTYAAFRLG